MESHQIEAIHRFIRSLLESPIQPTHEMVFNAIQKLKRAQDLDFGGSSKRWFRKWWQTNGLHKIKTKPLSAVRYAAAQESDVTAWFDQYERVLADLKIRNRRNIINFDEAGFRVGCMKGIQILVPTDMKEFYSINPENRKPITIVETINAVGQYPPPSIITVEGHDIMENWFDKPQRSS